MQSARSRFIAKYSSELSPTANQMQLFPNRRSVLSCLFKIATATVIGDALAQSPTDFVLGQVVKINAEHGTVTLRHDPIAQFYLPASTTTFRYVDPKLITRVKDGDRVRFRVDRYDGDLRLVLMVPMSAVSR